MSSKKHSSKFNFVHHGWFQMHAAICNLRAEREFTNSPITMKQIDIALNLASWNAFHFGLGATVKNQLEMIRDHTRLQSASLYSGPDFLEKINTSIKNLQESLENLAEQLSMIMQDDIDPQTRTAYKTLEVKYADAISDGYDNYTQILLEFKNFHSIFDKYVSHFDENSDVYKFSTVQKEDMFKNCGITLPPISAYEKVTVKLATYIGTGEDGHATKEAISAASSLISKFVVPANDNRTKALFFQKHAAQIEALKTAPGSSPGPSSTLNTSFPT